LYDVYDVIDICSIVKEQISDTKKYNTNVYIFFASPSEYNIQIAKYVHSGEFSVELSG